MKNWKQFLEAVKNKDAYYKVVVWWESSKPDKDDIIEHGFDSEEEMDEFLQFIWDYRGFRPNTAYGNLGAFSHNCYKQREWLRREKSSHSKVPNFKNIDKFEPLIPVNEYGWLAQVGHIHLLIGGVITTVIWEKALKTNIINLPIIGSEVELSTGHINGYTLGLEIFGGKKSDYVDYGDFKLELESKEEDLEHYYTFDAVLTDTRINFWKPYNHKKYDMRDGRENLISSKMSYSDYTSFQYVQLFRVQDDKYVVSTTSGYDPKFSDKFHYTQYGTNDYYLVK